MQRFFGGTMSRAEGYGLFFAAVLLIGGGISGAIVVTSGGEVAAPEPTVVATTVPPTPEATTTTGPPLTEAPTTTATRPAVDPQLGSLPATTIPTQPVQDFTAFCTMPNVLGPRQPLPDWSDFVARDLASVELAYADCTELRQRLTVRFCLDSGLTGTNWRIDRQDPAPGTLVHKLLGSVTVRIAMAAGPDPEYVSSWPSC